LLLDNALYSEISHNYLFCIIKAGNKIACFLFSVLSRLLHHDLTTEAEKMDNTRTRAWRLAQDRRTKNRGSGSADNDFPCEKNWKMLYIRSIKLARAAQLGIEYPRITKAQRLLKAKDEI